MTFFVNENCIGCGLCAGICPDVFTMSREGVAVASDQATPQFCLDTALEAKDSCPTEAIETKD